MIRSGNVAINIGRLRNSGINGYGWSSRADSSDVRYAYDLRFAASGVYPSGNYYRWGGFPLRCSSIDSNKSIRSGRVGIKEGFLLQFGRSGYKYASTGFVRTNVYSFTFNIEDSVRTSVNGYERFHAFPLRCLARQ